MWTDLGEIVLRSSLYGTQERPFPHISDDDDVVGEVVEVSPPAGPANVGLHNDFASPSKKGKEFPHRKL